MADGTKRTSHNEDTAPVRVRLDVRGRVQGVGFRPFVYRLATDLHLSGLVGNDTHGAFIEIEGGSERVNRFVCRLQAELPPLARIAELTETPLPIQKDISFRIDRSERSGVQDAEITPDVATCADCLAELTDPKDRRYRYPFINCTNCGPRYSIIHSIPYDRPNTTMARFVMCPDCQREYDDPANRRFHAQPNACPVCGPRLWLVDRAGHSLEGDAIAEAARRLRDGDIVAVKGIGGFHLACRADSDEAVTLLRERKNREAKPLAVMVDSLQTAHELAFVNEDAERELTRPERPIVLLPRRVDSSVSAYVAPGLDHVGVMLPYAPVHHLLFAEGLPPLVMTSGNPSEEPLCYDNDEALDRLSAIADAFLLHDRDIQRGIDDSVVLAGEYSEEPIVLIRRARGYAPAPIKIGHYADRAVLAVGGELKSSVCVLAGNQAVVSEHLGELSNAKAFRHFVDTIAQFKKLLEVELGVIACDLHPDYAATRYARTLGLPIEEVQHHHAHLVGCMADNGLTGRVVGITCDGTGFGTDGAIWGCEVLIGDEVDFERAAHLRYYPLLGGDAGARETWRPAAGLLHGYQNKDFLEWAPEVFGQLPTETAAMARQRFQHATRLPQTSSLGRLFDAVAVLLGICPKNRYEAEAAMQLEAAARRDETATALPVSAIGDGSDGKPIQLDIRPVLATLIAERRAGRPIEALARAFHETIAKMLVDAAVVAAKRGELDRIVLSGGCFANRLLAARVQSLLVDAGYEVFMHRQVPPGDGGLSLGQAVAASRRRDQR